jgi:cytochrome c-type biogenesis protein CcmH
MSPRSRRPLLRSLVACLIPLALAAACDRNIEPFDPAETPRKPDLSRIFPDPNASSAGEAGAPAAGGMAATAAAPARSETPRAGSGEPVRGSIEIAPELAGQLPAEAVLFVIARIRGASGGPPLAVLRLPAPRFPLPFEIGAQNLMIPSQRFEGDLTLTAQLDGDGNASTRLPGDLRGELPEPVRPGAEGVRLLLDQRL